MMNRNNSGCEENKNEIKNATESSSKKKAPEFNFNWRHSTGLKKNDSQKGLKAKKKNLISHFCN